MIRKIISIKTSTKKYKVYDKSFNDRHHFNNWMNAHIRYGSKIIGITEYTPEEKVNDIYTVNFK